MPPRPEGVSDEDIVAGLYRWAAAPEGVEHRASIVFSGSAHSAARAAQAELAEHHGVGVDLWSATSYKSLREEALAAERLRRLDPGATVPTPRVTRLLGEGAGPVVAVSDFMKIVPEQVARFVPRPFVPLGTDGFGRSDTREALRRFFEVDAAHVVVATLSALDDVEGARKAMDRNGIQAPDHR